MTSVATFINRKKVRAHARRIARQFKTGDQVVSVTQVAGSLLPELMAYVESVLLESSQFERDGVDGINGSCFSFIDPKLKD